MPTSSLTYAAANAAATAAVTATTFGRLLLWLSLGLPRLAHATHARDSSESAQPNPALLTALTDSAADGAH